MPKSKHTFILRVLKRNINLSRKSTNNSNERATLFEGAFLAINSSDNWTRFGTRGTVTESDAEPPQ